MEQEKKEDTPKKEEKTGQKEQDNTEQKEQETKKQEQTNPIEDAKKVLEEIKKQNELMNENIKKAERVGAEIMLSGRSPAGGEITKEQELEESARKLVEGTGLEELAGFKKRGEK